MANVSTTQNRRDNTVTQLSLDTVSKVVYPREMRLRCVIPCCLALAAVCVQGEELPVQSVSFGEWKLARILMLEGLTNHVQGIDFDSRVLWATSVDSANHKGYLREFSLTSGSLLREVEIQEKERFHPGGVASDGESLWMPVAEYRANSTSVIQKRSKRTLALEMSFNVPDHIGCVAVTPEYLIGGNWDSRAFYVWDHSGKLIRKVTSTLQNAYQDMKSEAGFLVASGTLADRSGAIDWIELPSFRLMRRVKIGNTDRQVPYTREGMAIRGPQLLLLPEDDRSRLFQFTQRP
jgi:hypothetical protein